jgi:uncharacterized protein YydD (DUF2326 family)
LSDQIATIERKLAKLNLDYTAKMSVLDQAGAFKTLRQNYAALHQKSEELGKLRSFIARLNDLENEKKRIRNSKENAILELDSKINAAHRAIKSLENTILDIHEYVQGKRKASFGIQTTTKKQVVQIVMRIDDDGSHSVDREKVFIYDLAALINEETRKAHPGILIHDNIFEVDDDTLRRGIKYVDEEVDLSEGRQYIVTINADRLEKATNNSTMYWKLRDRIAARYTKEKRFLRVKYQEGK